ncbi:ImmA/IrrE family metallo-endopeptidase [Rhodococcus sp. MTM3W5.2]|uniref:ImmA/IrrE family metallo-endopeptidase n=1 Tax=Rhodococcus sp. MTM3W5.2 TaxID=1805827 RepID=UPI0016778D44|nr:ImmA/IrrE family metallo-endopeptidase [Rhodococcus sp. MTM3W5.2]
MTWADAHRLANIAAAKAHAQLGIDPGKLPIDVAEAIMASGAILMWRPMPRLFGVYINDPGSSPGILVNSDLTPGARRFTAAHELGHHFLEHTTCTDEADCPSTMPTGDDSIYSLRERRGWTPTEKMAEAFAAWFLMPRRAVSSALRVLALDRPRDATDVYRLSLMLGVPHAAILRHLMNLRLATSDQVRRWSRESPGQIKRRLDNNLGMPASRWPDVWTLTPAFDGRTITVHDGDRLCVRVAAGYDVTAPDWLPEVAATAAGDGGPSMSSSATARSAESVRSPCLMVRQIRGPGTPFSWMRPTHLSG